MLPGDGVKLSGSEVMEIIEAHPNLVINHPTLGAYSFYRSDLLAKVKPRYINDGHEGFTDSGNGRKIN